MPYRNTDIPEAVTRLEETAIQDETLRTVVFPDILARMTAEVKERGATVPELLLVERVAFLYTWIHDRERLGDKGFIQQRNYKEILKLWTDMLAQLQKTYARADVELLRDEILDGVVDTIEKVIAKLTFLTPEQRATVLDEFVLAFDKPVMAEVTSLPTEVQKDVDEVTPLAK